MSVGITSPKVFMTNKHPPLSPHDPQTNPSDGSHLCLFTSRSSEQSKGSRRVKTRPLPYPTRQEGWPVIDRVKTPIYDQLPIYYHSISGLLSVDVTIVTLKEESKMIGPLHDYTEVTTRPTPLESRWVGTRNEGSTNIPGFDPTHPVTSTLIR